MFVSEVFKTSPINESESGAYIVCPNHQNTIFVTDVRDVAMLKSRLHQSLPPYEFSLLMEFPGVMLLDKKPTGIDNIGLPINKMNLKELIFKIKDWFHQQEWITSGNFGYTTRDDYSAQF